MVPLKSIFLQPRNEKMKHYITLILIFSNSVLWAQPDMSPGFRYLEKQEYAEATDFFENILDNFPGDKTASICYGRAVGLNGSVEKAMDIFYSLIKIYPEDREIFMNIAESHMWAKDPENAIPVYQKLIDEKRNDLDAIIGLANAYFSSKDFESAYKTIMAARALDNKNSRAMNAQKHISLAMSNQLVQNGDFTNANALVDSLVLIFPDDRDVILNKAVLYLLENQPSKAHKLYQRLVIENIDPLEGHKGLAYTNLLLNKKKKSLEHLIEAQSLSVLLDTSLILRRAFGHALIGEFKKADIVLDSFISNHPGHKDALMTKSKIEMVRGNFRLADSLISHAIDFYRGTFELYMTKAEIQRSRQNLDETQTWIKKALALNPHQPDALRLYKSLRAQDKPLADLNVLHRTDNGSNNASVISLSFHNQRYGKFRTFIQWTHQQNSTPHTLESATINRFTLSGTYLKNERFSMHLSAGPVIFHNSESSNNNLGFEGSSKMTYNITHNHTLSTGISHQYQSYTANLINRKTGLLSTSLAYNGALFGGSRIYTQLDYTRLSDANNKKLIYISVYKNVMANPSVKTGMSFSSFGFDESRPQLYFSPTSFKSGEAFAEVHNYDNTRATFKYRVAIRGGIQQIMNNSVQHLYGYDVEMGKTWKNLDCSFQLRFSNSGVNMSEGYSVTSISANIKYRFN